jgi:hypothetical protein
MKAANMTTTRREKAATIVLTASYLGTFGTVFLALALLLHWPDFFRGLGVGLLVASLFALLLRQLRDEYLQGLWSAGASWAFVATVIWVTAVPLYLDTFVGSRTDAWVPDIPAIWTFIVALAAFFAGFHWTRLRA